MSGPMSFCGMIRCASQPEPQPQGLRSRYEWPVVPHAWQLMGRLLPEGRQSLQAALAFVLQAVEGVPSQNAVAQS